MENIKFKVSELLDIIRTNRAAHRNEFEIAVAGYEVEAIKGLQALVRRVREGQRMQLMVNMPIPMDHTNDYDRIIRMLEMSQDTVVVLDEHDFAQYVQDDWAWKGQFNITNAAYNATGSAAMAKKAK